MQRGVRELLAVAPVTWATFLVCNSDDGDDSGTVSIEQAEWIPIEWVAPSIAGEPGPDLWCPRHNNRTSRDLSQEVARSLITALQIPLKRFK